MPPRAKTSILSELVQEFVEERVRGFPGEAFDLAGARDAVRAALRDSGEPSLEREPVADAKLTELLDRHPFLIRAAGKGPPAWKPGLKKG